jgi:hypothetical protein
MGRAEGDQTSVTTVTDGVRQPKLLGSRPHMGGRDCRQAIASRSPAVHAAGYTSYTRVLNSSKGIAVSVSVVPAPNL